MTTSSFRPQVAAAFEVLAEGLAPVVDARMTRLFPGQDWILVAATKLGKRREVLVSLVDPHFQLEVINRWWGPAFSPVLPDSIRPVITELRTARNHWAHPDAEHPLDLDYALRIHRAAEALLMAVGSEQATAMAELADELRWDDVRERARHQGEGETAVLFEELTHLQQEHEALEAQLIEAREAATSATGRSRAVSRQLAELQTQYAAVTELRDDYLVVQRQLEVGRSGTLTDHRAGRSGPAEADVLRQRLDQAATASSRLQAEAEHLREELVRTRAEIADVDPLRTDIGRRWVWLVAVLVLVLGLLIGLVGFIPR